MDIPIHKILILKVLKLQHVQLLIPIWIIMESALREVFAQTLNLVRNYIVKNLLAKILYPNMFGWMEEIVLYKLIIVS